MIAAAVPLPEISLRPYQMAIVTAIRAAFSAKKRAPLVVLPTGGGKTTIFAYVADKAAELGRTIFIVAHRAELVRQIAMTLAKFKRTHQVIAPPAIVRQVKAAQFLTYGRTMIDPRSKVYVCSVQTLVKRLADLAESGVVPDIIVFDEAHHLTEGSTWGIVAAAYPTAKLLPVTATPIRLDNKGLGIGCGGFADEIIIGPRMSWLIDEGYLSKYKLFWSGRPVELPEGAKHKRAGDWKKETLSQAMDKPTITGDAVENYLLRAPGKRAVAFCVSVQHAENVAAAFNAAGIPSAVLDGALDPTVRDARIKAFEAGEILVLTSCDVVSEGFDVPAIEVAILLRPTESLSMFLQQVGRALRAVYAPGFDLETQAGRLAAQAAGPKRFAIIIDHVGAIVRHLTPDWDHEWTLDGVLPRKRAANDDEVGEIEEGVAEIMTCPKCRTIHLPAPKCPGILQNGDPCGHVYPIKSRNGPRQVEGELTEFTVDMAADLKRRRLAVQGMARSEEALVASGVGRARAKKIVAGREKSDSLRLRIWDGTDAITEHTGATLLEEFGVTSPGMMKMKPLDLEALLGRVKDRARALGLDVYPVDDAIQIRLAG